jgi:2-polyprenyl-3-methyl-5-hydroxy-6-metoxy-1,4-benzoquinol methylase
MEVIGDPRGMAVLDVACGEGFYTRMLRQRGAARVTGVDLSPAMIDLARLQEAQHELGIEYVVGNALSPEGLRANDREFWSTFLDHSPVAFIECVK